MHWINLGPWPVFLAYTNNEETFRSEMKRIDGPGPDALPWPTCSGHCSAIEAGGKLVLVIITQPNVGGHTIAHEAQHAMREIMEFCGEKEPGHEAEAYLVGYITGCIEAILDERSMPDCVPPDGFFSRDIMPTSA